ncbi:MAG TPA: gfo/Idh/MocA family oxidoreductase, partial [Candidatus Avipropionibacterium avicola]|nr:gfo/Idh/MocA family oxidoreductase [Candidatus Avipropionibacterium avicola]
HVIDLAWYLMGSPKVASISANTYEHLGNRANVTTFPRYTVADYDPSKNDVEDMANAMIRFDNGASILVDVSFSLHAPKDEIAVAVHGTKGGADLEPSLQIATEQHGSMVNVVPQLRSSTFELENAFVNETANFVDTCLGQAESIAPAWQGVEVMKILEGIYTSAAERREITF